MTFGATENDFDADNQESQVGGHTVTVLAPGREKETLEVLRLHGAYDVHTAETEPLVYENVVTDYTRLGSLDEGTSVADSSGL